MSSFDADHVGPTTPTLPPVDARLAPPETRFEVHDGELVYVSPADPPHGERHLQLAALIEAHTGFEFEAAADLLTRTSRVDDIAPDVSVYPPAPDPTTGGRQLEQLAFEIISTHSLGRATTKAIKLTARGVRRVLAIDVERSRVLEWSSDRGAWHRRTRSSARPSAATSPRGTRSSTSSRVMNWPAPDRPARDSLERVGEAPTGSGVSASTIATAAGPLPGP